MPESTTPKLFVQPRQAEFKAGQAKAFREYLRAVDASTLVIPAISSHELQLEYTGRTRKDQYRYSELAFHQIAKILAPGLSRTVLSLAGSYRGPDEPREHFNFHTAVDVFNKVVELRYPTTMAQRRLVISKKSNTIEGVLGPKTQFLDNGELSNLVSDAVRGARDSVNFHSATLAGRQLVLRYLHADPLITIPGEQEDLLYSGYHFANTETGDSSVRGGRLIYRSLTDSAALRLVSGGGSGRLSHTGKGFMGRLRSLVGHVLQDDAEVRPKTAIARLKSRKLNLPANNPTQLAARISRIQSRLVRRGLNNNVAERVVRRAAYVGSYTLDYEKAVREVRRAEICERTEFDLYNALGVEGSQLGIRFRELLETTAFDLFIGKFSVGER